MGYYTEKAKEVKAKQDAELEQLKAALQTLVVETEERTIDDPIPAARGMEYEYGKYYLDPEDGKTYLCKRGDETGSIVLYYLPHELIGQYFEEVT